MGKAVLFPGPQRLHLWFLSHFEGVCWKQELESRPAEISPFLQISVLFPVAIYFLSWSLDCEQESDEHLGRSREKWHRHEQREAEWWGGHADACLPPLEVAAAATAAQWGCLFALGAWCAESGVFRRMLPGSLWWGLAHWLWWQVSSRLLCVGWWQSTLPWPVTPSQKRQGSSGEWSWAVLPVTQPADDLMPQPRVCLLCLFKWSWPVLGRSWVSSFLSSIHVGGKRKWTRST